MTEHSLPHQINNYQEGFYDEVPLVLLDASDDVFACEFCPGCGLDGVSRIQWTGDKRRQRLADEMDFDGEHRLANEATRARRRYRHAKKCSEKFMPAANIKTIATSSMAVLSK